MSSAVTLQLEMMRLAVTRHACRHDTCLCGCSLNHACKGIFLSLCSSHSDRRNSQGLRRSRHVT